LLQNLNIYIYIKRERERERERYGKIRVQLFYRYFFHELSHGEKVPINYNIYLMNSVQLLVADFQLKFVMQIRRPVLALRIRSADEF